MSSRRGNREFVCVFAHVDALMEAIRSIRQQDAAVENVYSPVPHHDLVDLVEKGKSPVRFITFTGAITGLISGLALALLTSLVWNLIVSGKPVTAIIPFLVVGFELTILFGAIGTLLALLFFSRLPFIKFPDRGYRPEFSKDRFGLWLSCDEAKAADVTHALEQAGVEQIIDISSPAESGKEEHS